MSDYFVETSIKKIKEASENNKLVVFVGAGVSANSGIPTWGELITEMAKDLGDFDVKNSSDTYLKIPQFYYNERGEKEYFEKLNEVFLSRKYKTNPLHNEIFKLNPTHIITTNYDTLLEEAAIEGGYFYHVVRHDLDLPYDNLNKTIIKMHGDFENRNIVLKEDDYLNYSSNFTLIENHLKSLIATNTVLFIGYSVNDPNFNLIFQWVKSILKNHFQPAYLIESSKEYSRMEHHYYKNRGINIIYYDEINSLQKNEIFEDSNWRGNRLYDVIKHFNTFNKANSLNELEYVYDKLKCFEKLNFIMPGQIIKSLNLKSSVYDLSGDKTITCLQDENILTNIFSNNEQLQEENLFKKISLIFNKANIAGISKDTQVIFGEKEGNNYLDGIMNEIIASDSLMETKDIKNPNNIILDKNYFLMLKQAFVHYESENFLEAYRYYKSISLKSFSDKEYLIYYISEFNRKHVGDMLVNFSLNTLDVETRLEIEELDIEEIYLKLPYKERKSLEFVKEIQNFNLIYRAQNKLTKEVEQLKKTKRTVENGGFSINSALSKNFNIIINIWLFIKANYLCLEKYTEVQNLYKKFIEGIIESYCTKSENDSNGMFSNFKVNKIDELDLFAVYIIITKLKTKDLEAILSEYNLKQVNIEPAALEYLTKLLDKVLDNIQKNKNIEKSKKYFYNLLTLLSKLNLESNQLNLIAEKLLLIFDEEMYINEFKYVNKFIVSGASKEILTQEIVVRYLVAYLKMYRKNQRIREFDTAGLYKNLTLIYINDNDSLIAPSVMSDYLELIDRRFKEKDFIFLYELMNGIILPIIKGVTETQQDAVLDIVRELINEIEHKEERLKHYEISFYFSVLRQDISFSNEEINRKILEDTVSKIESRNVGFRAYPDPVKTNLDILTDMYKIGCLQKKEIEDYVDQFKGFSEYFDLVFNNMELNLTDIKLISFLTDVEIEEIMKNSDKVKEQVYNLLDKNLFKDQP
ncbi:SIR2 family protein, partial [Bacillus toyonensis]